MNIAISTALSGLAASATAVDAIGNNLANLNTSGYKATGLAFQDMMSQALGAGSSTSAPLGHCLAHSGSPPHMSHLMGKVQSSWA